MSDGVANMQRARFVGTDGSLGYRYGETYTLVVRRDHPYWSVTIRREDGSGFCPYASEEAFERNWKT
jgi:hypothetical protein